MRGLLPSEFLEPTDVKTYSLVLRACGNLIESRNTLWVLVVLGVELRRRLRVSVAPGGCEGETYLFDHIRVRRDGALKELVEILDVCGLRSER